MAAVPLSSSPERLTSVLIGQARFEVERVWTHRDSLIFKFRGIDSISAAEPLAGLDVCIPAEERAPLPDGEYYQSDLIGYRVADEAGTAIGAVESIEEYGGPPLLAVKTEKGQEILIPFAKAICVSIDAAERKITVALPEGLDSL